MRFFSLVVIGLLGACSGPRLPPPNSVNAQYDARQRAVQVMVSGLQPPTDATLVANDGARYAASGIVTHQRTSCPLQSSPLPQPGFRQFRILGML